MFWFLTRSHVAGRPGNGGHGVGRAGLHQHPGQPEVRDLGSELGVQQDVAGLDVPVNDGLGALVVHVAVPLRGADGDYNPRGPVQTTLHGRRGVLGTVGESVHVEPHGVPDDVFVWLLLRIKQWSLFILIEFTLSTLCHLA